MERFVYLLKCQDKYKIGIAKDGGKSRIKGLQTGNPEDIEVVTQFLSVFPSKLETILHKHFQMERKRGEWFLLNQDQVNSFIELCEKNEKLLIFLKDNNSYCKKW